MPEYAVGAPLLPFVPPSLDELKARIAAIRRSSQEREARIDQTFIDAVRSLTTIDLTDPIAAGRRAETLSGGVLGPEGILIDQLFTSATASGADLPPGVDSQGRPLAVNQNQQDERALRSKDKAGEVVMPPMWMADP